MRLIYPQLWSRLGREADREQAVSTAAALARTGVEVTLLVPREPNDPRLTPSDVRAFFDVQGEFTVQQRDVGHVSPSLVPSVRWLLQACRDPLTRAAEVCYGRIPAMLALGGRSPRPFAFDHYRPWPDDWPWLRPLIRRTARSARCLGFILHSNYAAQSYLRAGVPSAQVQVAHNGADPRLMLPRLDKRAARIQVGLPVDRAIAVYAGRVNAEKGLDAVLTLAARQRDVLFLLVGSEGEGPIERAAAALSNVRVLPWQTPAALSAYLYAADVLIVPPARAPLERFSNCVLPMKVFRYLAAGRPILAPRAADTAELLRDDDTACLVAPDDAPAAVAALDRLLQDAALAARLGHNAERLAERLTWDARAATINAFLEGRLAAVRR